MLCLNITSGRRLCKFNTCICTKQLLDYCLSCCALPHSTDVKASLSHQVVSHFLQLYMWRALSPGKDKQLQRSCNSPSSVLSHWQCKWEKPKQKVLCQYTDYMMWLTSFDLGHWINTTCTTHRKWILGKYLLESTWLGIKKSTWNPSSEIVWFF